MPKTLPVIIANAQPIQSAPAWRCQSALIKKEHVPHTHIVAVMILPAATALPAQLAIPKPVVAVGRKGAAYLSERIAHILL